MISRLRAQAAKADQQTIREAFLRATQFIARMDEHVFSHMRESGNPDIVDQILPLTLEALRPLVDQLTKALTQEAQRIAYDSYLHVALVSKSYVEKAPRKKKTENPFADRDSPLTEDVIRKHVAKLVVDIGKEQRRTLKRVIARRFDPDSRSNDTLVKDIKATVGLTEREANAVMNFRDSLEERGISGQRMDSEVKKYHEKLHQKRAERIARTESVRVETTGRRAGWGEAQKDGFLSKEAQTEWVASAGACDECRGMDGETAALKGGTFKGPEGPIHGPPAHPHCECDVVVTDPG